MPDVRVEPDSESPTRAAVRRMTAEGKKPREIADSLGVSTQRVHQHLRRIRELDERASA